MKQPWYSIFYIKSPIIKIGLAIVAILVSIALILFQGLIDEQRMAAQDASWHGRSTEIGAELYANNCASCHGPDGKGLPVVAPALNSRYFFTQRLNDVGWAGSLDQYVLLTLHAGRPSKVSTQWVNVMPTWGTDFGGPMRERPGPGRDKLRDELAAERRVADSRGRSVAVLPGFALEGASLPSGRAGL